MGGINLRVFHHVHHVNCDLYVRLSAYRYVLRRTKPLVFHISDYLPLYYQAVRHASASKSGVDILPYMLSTMGCLLLSGVIIRRTGHYWTLMFCGPWCVGIIDSGNALMRRAVIRLAAIAAGLLFTINEHTQTSRLIGFQILWGFGVGCNMQSSSMAVMAEVPSHRMVAQAMAVATFFQRLGATVGLPMYVPLLSSLCVH